MGVHALRPALEGRGRQVSRFQSDLQRSRPARATRRNPAWKNEPKQPNKHPSPCLDSQAQLSGALTLTPGLGHAEACLCWASVDRSLFLEIPVAGAFTSFQSFPDIAITSIPVLPFCFPLSSFALHCLSLLAGRQSVPQHRKAIEQLVGVGSLLLPCGPRGAVPGFQAVGHEL